MPIWWYVARASGLMAWAMLTLTVVWGLLLSSKLLGRKPAPAWILDLHRFIGGATVVFTVVHLVAILADSYVHFVAAVELTSLLRKSLPNPLWRRVHYATVPLFALATIHGVTAGTDSRTTFAFMVLASVVLVVGLLTATRVGRTRSAPVPVRSARPTRQPVGARPGSQP